MNTALEKGLETGLPMVSTPGLSSAHASDLSAAIASLSSAVSALEAASARRASRSEQTGDMETELALMRDDRAKLAAELDAEVARANTLDTVRNDVSARLEKAIVTIRTILARDSAKE